ncbi:Multidrug resistance-associated protein 4, partial [Cichlidogyrus casuarinus]
WIIKEFNNLKKTGDKTFAIIYAILLICNMFCSVLLRNQQFYYGALAGMRMRIASSGLLFNKVLTLNQKSLAKTTSGQIFNLLSTDVRRFEMSFMYVHYFWIGSIHCIVVLTLMYVIAGYPALVTVAIMFVLNILQALSGRFMSNIKLKMSQDTDQRVKLISNVISGIKAIKVYVWESTFLKAIFETRARETKRMMYVRLCQSFYHSQLMYQRDLGFLFFYIANIYLTSSFDPQTLSSYYIYTIMGLINALFLSLTLFLPPSIQAIADLNVTCERLRNFLNLD